MLYLELRWLVFGLLVAICGIAALIVWLAQRRTRLSLPPEDEWALLDHAPLGLLAVDDDNTIRYANTPARALLEWAEPVQDLPAEEWIALLNGDRQAARRQNTTVGRYDNIPLPSGQSVRWWVTPWHDLDVIFLLDTTARRRSELAASHLLSDLSHELRTPLATILTHMEVLLLTDVSDEIRQRSLYLLKAEAQRMARLINDMLELGRLETNAQMDLRPTDLLALAEQALAQIAPQAEERGIHLSLQADTPLPWVLGDRNRLLQVLLNLLDNAIKYSAPEDRVEVRLRQSGQTVECSVSDTGPGIPDEHLVHMPRRFYRAASRDVEGSGLGLVLAQEILRHHQSTLVLSSQTDSPDSGTRVQFSLPLSEREGGR